MSAASLPNGRRSLRSRPAPRCPDKHPAPPGRPNGGTKRRARRPTGARTTVSSQATAGRLGARRAGCNAGFIRYRAEGMTIGRLHALLLLSWSFLVMLTKKVFGTGPRGLALFRRNFDAERLSSVGAEEREDIIAFGRCIACGRCERGDGARIAASRGAYPGTMALMVASSRSMPDLAAAAEALRWIRDDELAEKEPLCPTGVPMRRVAAFVRAHAGIVDRSDDGNSRH